MITVDMSQMRTQAIEKASPPVQPSGEIKIIMSHLDEAISLLEAQLGDLVSQLQPVLFMPELPETKVPSPPSTPIRTQLGGALSHLTARVEELRMKLSRVNAGLEL